LEPISADVIEHADDFIFHLSDNQLKEWLEDLKKKQPGVYDLIHHNATRCVGLDTKNYIFRIELTLIQCFNDYGIQFPIFKKKYIVNCEKWYNTKVILKANPADANVSVMDMGESIGQKEMMQYIIDKFNESKTQLQFIKGIVAGNILANCLLLLEVYSRQIRNHLPDSSKK
jgi:hypothetical protein